MGWLLATPEGQEQNNFELFGETLPEVPAAERLLEVWDELGRAASGLSGAQRFTWSELDAYNRLTGANLTNLEADCLVQMSQVYSIEIRSTQRLRKSPMEREE